MSETEKPQNDNTVQANASTEAPKPTQTFQNSPEDAKYLVAEDNTVNQKILGIMFGRMELNYHAAWNGQQALDMYKANPERCRLILMDTSMPVMDGLKASTLIRQYEKENGLLPAIIVGMTAQFIGLESEEQRLKDKYGMDTTLSKPVRPQHFKELVDSYPV
ncbi:hypothetical protein FSARC_4753 [Fusarium sarcochroum]|uniref:Response regulatory domain-containing protein n=1 Tax=Fusarium sarcochroum TaxID=1208366 RepID=A0A8H4U0V6_9HYPO|nr:hypothetical protein FSARC_4753 [Fusarium sarcochroum]